MPTNCGRLTKTERRQKALEAITAAIVAGARCPTNDETGVGQLPALAREGLIKIEVFAHNWRVVTMMVGEHRGKTTMRQPNGQKPYKVIYKDHVKFRRATP